MQAETITKDSMAEGVASCKVFLLFLSAGVLTRPFCIFEIKAAMAQQRKMMLMHETDSVSLSRFGPYFSSFCSLYPKLFTEARFLLPIPVFQ